MRIGDLPLCLLAIRSPKGTSFGEELPLRSRPGILTGQCGTKRDRRLARVGRLLVQDLLDARDRLVGCLLGLDQGPRAERLAAAVKI
jgi:hypothetical protein